MRQTTSTILRPDLLGYTLGFNQLGMAPIAHKILRPIIVSKRIDSIDTVSAADLARQERTRRAPGTAWPRGSVSFSTDTYQCLQYGFSEAVDRGVQADRPELGSEQTAAVMAAGVVVRGFEKIVADAVINETNFPVSGSTGVTLTTPWNAGGTPGQDVAAGIAALRGKYGVGGMNCGLEIPYNQFLSLPFNSDVRQRLQISTAPFPGSLTLQQLALYFGVAEVVVGGMTYNSAGQGVNATMAEYWNEDYAFLYIRREGDGPSSLKMPHLGSTFVWDWNGQVRDQWPAEGGSIPYSVRSYPEDGTDSDVVVVDHYVDPKFIQSGAGYLIKNVKA